MYELTVVGDRIECPPELMEKIKQRGHELRVPFVGLIRQGLERAAGLPPEHGAAEPMRGLPEGVALAKVMREPTDPFALRASIGGTASAGYYLVWRGDD